MKRWLKWVITVCVFVLVFGYAVGAQAQRVCGQRAEIVKRLKNAHEEHQNSVGIAANGNLVEVFAAKKGNWTIIVTKPGGPTCLIAVGENFQRIEEPYGVEGQLIVEEGEEYPEEPLVFTINPAVYRGRITVL